MITQALSTRLSVRGRLSPKGFDKALRRWFPLCYLCAFSVALTEPHVLLIRSDPFHWHYWLRVAVIALAALTCLKMDVLVIRRLHDSDRSGWWCAPILLIQGLALTALAFFTGMRADDPRWTQDMADHTTSPLWGLPYALLCLVPLFLSAGLLFKQLECPGTPGENRYGPRSC